MFYKLFVPLAAGVLSTGCASTAATFFNRPVVEDSVKGAISTVSLAADRRTVVVVTEGPNRSRFCAEPPPDTATGLSTELEAKLEAKAQSEKVQAELEGKGELNEKTATSVTVIAERTASLDAFRTGIYALCQLHLNGAINQSDVKPLFENLLSTFRTIEQARAGKP